MWCSVGVVSVRGGGGGVVSIPAGHILLWTFYTVLCTTDTAVTTSPVREA